MLLKRFLVLFLNKEMNDRTESFMTLFKIRLCALFGWKLAKCFVSENHIYVVEVRFRRLLLSLQFLISVYSKPLFVRYMCWHENWKLDFYLKTVYSEKKKIPTEISIENKSTSSSLNYHYMGFVSEYSKHTAFKWFYSKSVFSYIFTSVFTHLKILKLWCKMQF